MRPSGIAPALLFALGLALPIAGCASSGPAPATPTPVDSTAASALPGRPGPSVGGTAPDSSAVASARGATAPATGAAALFAGDAVPAAEAVALALRSRDDEAAMLAILELVARRGGLEGLPPEGRYLYGLALESSSRYTEAADAYESYGRGEPAMADVAALAAGSALFHAGLYDRAAAALERARTAAGDSATAYLAAVRLGNALLRSASPADALRAYEDAERMAADDDQRAQALSGMMAVHARQGDAGAESAVRRRLVAEMPGAELAAAALDRLAASGQPAPPEVAAAVAAGRGDHETAARLLSAAIEADPAAHSDLYAALAASYAALGRDADVVAVADELLGRAGGAARAPDVAWQAARSLARADRIEEAAEAYARFADRWPGEPRAARARWLSARLRENLGDPGALDAYVVLADRHPDASQAHEALFRAGLLAWRSGHVPRAAELWSAQAEDPRLAGDERARAHYWLGRMAADVGDVVTARSHWTSARDEVPDGYYGLRAADRLGLPAATMQAAAGATTAASGTRTPGGDGEGSGATRSESGIATAGSTPAEADAAGAIGAWLATWVPRLAGDGWATVHSRVMDGRDVARARAWLAIGERRAAVRAIASAAHVAREDAAASAALALEASRLGLHGAASSAASRTIALAPAGARAAAPDALWRLAYPDAYRDVVEVEAAATGLSPALVLAVIRQESRFEPTARSGAGAAGLMQVMPGTGRGIAAQLDDAGFDVEDLYEPAVAVRYGAWYLARQLEEFEGSVPAALAAYNGGPGNARRWWQMSGGDADLFVEAIDYEETAKYVRLVTEHLAQYERLYGLP